MTQKDSITTQKATVFGGSIAGLMSAFILVKLGYDVVLYEKRTSYSRNIQWGVRQSFINYLAWINKDMADKFMKISSAIPNGYRFFADVSSLYSHGAYLHKRRSQPVAGNAENQNLNGDNTLDEEIVCLVPAKELESLLYEEIKKINTVTIHHKKSPQLNLDPKSGFYSVIEDGVTTEYDLVVISEGAASKTRDDIGILSIPLSKSIKQVSGEVHLKRYGMIIEHLHAIKHEDRLREEFLLSLLISTESHKSCWIAGDVSSKCLAELEHCQDSSKKQDIMKEEFKKVAARTMFDAESNINNAGFRGAVNNVKLFELQSKISSKAIAGNNVVLTGDAVGVGHWSVGGGMHVAGVCHSYRLHELASSLLSNSGARQSALKKFNEAVLTDTIAWLSRGIKDYYLSVPGDVLRAVFDKLIVELLEDNTIDFREKLKARVVSAYFD